MAIWLFIRMNDSSRFALKHRRKILIQRLIRCGRQLRTVGKAYFLVPETSLFSMFPVARMSYRLFVRTKPVRITFCVCIISAKRLLLFRIGIGNMFCRRKPKNTNRFSERTNLCKNKAAEMFRRLCCVRNVFRPACLKSGSECRRFFPRCRPQHIRPAHACLRRCRNA